ncbi:MAG TPA: hypothetical protein PLK31_26990, partial [Chloroflexota bacterium]|nr:hypothetical protein [Chloroflexota bacterium]
TLIMSPHETQQMVYALGNAAGEEIMALENAYYPIWLDGRTLAYLQSIPSNNPHQPSENKLMTAVITGDNSVEIENRLTMEEIRATLPDLPPTSQLYLAGMTSYPAAQPEQLFLSVFDWQGNMAQRGYLLQYDWQEHEWSSIDSEFVSATWGDIRQHGRYLTVGGYTNAGYAIHLYDIPNQRWQVYEVDNSRFLSGSPAAWSEDGNWFILLDSGLIRLVAPEHRYEKRLFHGLDYCGTALFVDRERRDETGP